MSYQTIPGRQRFRRRSDKAMIGGVCAGIADYFGFNLKVTRLLAVIAMFMATPLVLIGYLALCLLVPAEARLATDSTDPEFAKSLRSSPAQAASDVRRRFKSLDRRLARLEKTVTSSRYQLHREFEKL